MEQYVTYEMLFAFTMVLVSVATYAITSHKKK